MADTSTDVLSTDALTAPATGPVSVLFPPGHSPGAEVEADPPFFADVNLDQIVGAAVHGREEYGLRTFFRQPLADVAIIEYRQRVGLDLDGRPLTEAVRRFARAMQTVRRGVAFAGRVESPQVAWRWMVDSALTYTSAVTALGTALDEAEPDSDGLRAMRGYVDGYRRCEAFERLAGEASAVVAGLDRVRFSLTVRGLRIQVRRHTDDDDFAARVEATFARFRHGAVKDYRTEVRDTTTVGHIEAQILDRVARLFPAEFAAARTFARAHAAFVDETVARFDREVQFYLAWQDFLDPLRAAGIAVCYPRVSAEDDRFEVRDLIDAALARRGEATDGSVVGNDLHLRPEERIVVVTGPNQGGKTTFARSLTQLCHLARIGLPVTASAARLPLVGGVFTHFERGENLTDLRGKLQDDLIRIRDILAAADDRGLLVLNEIFTSTTLADATALSGRILDAVTASGAWCVCVTFIDELATHTPTTVSMVAGVDPDDPGRRTYHLERRPADGRAYAAALAGRYGLSYAQVREAVSA